MAHEWLPRVIALVEEAGAAILPYWRSGVAVVSKADDSPVTAADLAAHGVLQAGLGAIDPRVPVLSEEDAEIPHGERVIWQRWWLVDPLDGTKEFIADSEEFTVNVALIEDGQVVFGVVGVPARGQLYWGGAGLGAWRISAGETRPIAVRDTPTAALTLVASRRHGSPAQECLLEGLRREVGDVQLQNAGSSLKFCLLAEGAADCYPRLAPTSQWDTAAAQAVLEGAGGEVLDLAGRRLSYEARSSYLNPSFLALPAQAPWRATLLRLAANLE